MTLALVAQWLARLAIVPVVIESILTKVGGFFRGRETSNGPSVVGWEVGPWPSVGGAYDVA